MSGKSQLHPIVVSTQYSEALYNDYSALEESLKRILNQEYLHKGWYTSYNVDDVSPLLLHYPVVYVIAAKTSSKNQQEKYIAYVGETNDIRQRTLTHMVSDSGKRQDFGEFRALSASEHSVTQYIIGHEHFNKSLTLDTENKIIEFLICVDNVENCNRRGNIQGNYYTKQEFDSIFESIWLELHRKDPELFPSIAMIQDSAIFKVSPFHQLTEEQEAVENEILSLVKEKRNSKTPKSSQNVLQQQVTSGIYSDTLPHIILVHGAAGTGKTVLLSHLFDRLVTEQGFNNFTTHTSDDDARGYVLVNHEQQLHVYSQIAKKLGWQDKNHTVVMKPVSFIRTHSKKLVNEKGKVYSYDVNEIASIADLVLVDEAHLLLTQKNQAYYGTNMLLDIAKRSNVVVAVFDPNQVLQSNQRWDRQLLEELGIDGIAAPLQADGTKDNTHIAHVGDTRYRVTHVYLKQQMRMGADEATVAWLDNFIAGNTIYKLPSSVNRCHNADSRQYDIRVFDSPCSLFSAIKNKDYESTCEKEGKGLSRVVATYDWPYTAGKDNVADPTKLWNVCMRRVDGIWKVADPAEMGFASDLSSVSQRYLQMVKHDNDEDLFCHPWNYEYERFLGKVEKSSSSAAWAEKESSRFEVGSTFSIQGFDLNYVGVIIGPSFGFDNETQSLVIRPTFSYSRKAVAKRDSKLDYAIENLRNELNVLLKRGVHGLYLFAVDPDLQRALHDALG